MSCCQNAPESELSALVEVFGARKNEEVTGMMVQIQTEV